MLRKSSDMKIKITTVNNLEKQRQCREAENCHEYIISAFREVRESLYPWKTRLKMQKQQQKECENKKKVRTKDTVNSLGNVKTKKEKKKTNF